MNNYEIADHFSLLSKLMDIHGEDSFKAKSYSNAAFNIERLTSELAVMSDAEMAGQKGIGASTAKKDTRTAHYRKAGPVGKHARHYPARDIRHAANKRAWA